jgi:hypothetical protein
VIPTSPRSSKMESGCSSYDCYGFSCFCLFQGWRLQPRRAGDSSPKCVFAIFVQSFGPEPPGTFARPENPTLVSGDSGRCEFLGGACSSNGSQGLFGAWPETLASKGRRLQGKCPATTSFHGGPI